MDKKEQARIRAREWYKLHRSHAIKRISEYNKRNKKRRKQYTWNYRHNLRLEAFQHYSKGEIKCACCGEKHQEFLTLDHVKNNGAEERKQISGAGKSGGHNFYLWLKKRGYPEGYQILCLNCNASKSWWGYCPHQKEKTEN